MVRNLTLKIDEEVLRRARIKALEQDTSVNQLVRDYLERLAGQDARRDGLDQFLRVAQRSTAGSGPGGRTWQRDDLHGR